jgi:predicted nucleic acid-binding protein
MAASIVVDAGFLVALLSRRDTNHRWAIAQPPQHPPPWKTCEAVVAEAFHLLGYHNATGLATLLRRRMLTCTFQLSEDIENVLGLMRKYADVPMSLADACLVRMTETAAEPVLLTTDSDFRIYRRHSRQTIPAVMPSR